MEKKKEKDTNRLVFFRFKVFWTEPLMGVYHPLPTHDDRQSTHHHTCVVHVLRCNRTFGGKEKKTGGNEKPNYRNYS
jgi:hypothetical protein